MRSGCCVAEPHNMVKKANSYYYERYLYCNMQVIISGNHRDVTFALVCTKETRFHTSLQKKCSPGHLCSTTVLYYDF